MTSMFTDNFPSVSNQKELDKLKAEHPEYDEYYVTSGSIPNRRKEFDRLYEKYHSYADPNFLSEVKKQFHQRTWEMYLGCTLLERKILFTKKKKKNKGPDFLVKIGRKIWIECIACTKGSESSADKVPQLLYGISQSVPEDEMCMRLTSALNEKHRVYQKYLKEGIVASSDVFIIAINAGALDYPDAVIPLVLKCLFAIGHPMISVPIGGGEARPEWSKRYYIKKKNGSEIPMNFFLDKNHIGISGVFYCRNNVLNHSDILGDDIVAISNPIAKNPFPVDVFRSFKGYHFDPSVPNWLLPSN